MTGGYLKVEAEMEGQVSGDIGGSTEVFVLKLRWRKRAGTIWQQMEKKTRVLKLKKVCERHGAPANQKSQARPLKVHNHH